MTQPLRVLLALPSLQGGGAERVAVNIIKHIDRTRFDARLGLLKREGPYLAEVDPRHVLDVPVPGQLEVEGDNRSLYSPRRIIAMGAMGPRILGAQIRAFRPQVVMSFLKGMALNAWFTTTLYGRNRTKFIAREGNNTRAVIEDELTNPLARKAMLGVVAKCFRSADRVLTIAHEMADTLSKDLRIPAESFRTVHNAIEVDRIRELGDEGVSLPLPDRFLVAVGRLDRQKGFDVLIRALARLEGDPHLVILGEGPERAALEQQVKAMGLSQRVHMPGFLANPWAIMARADAFVLPSRWEGFGNVVAESLALGVPTVVSNCQFGPKEIVENGRSGLVFPVDDVESLVAALDHLRSNPEVAQTLVREGTRRVEAFRAGSVVAQYERVFEEVAGDQSR